MPAISRNMTIPDLDVTVMGNDLELSRVLTEGVQLELDSARILEIRDGLAKMPGYDVGSDNNPLILGSTGKASHYSSRHKTSETRKLPDVQVNGVTVSLEGNRLIFNKEGVRFFVTIDSTQSSVLRDTLTAALELNEPPEEQQARAKKKRKYQI